MIAVRSYRTERFRECLADLAPNVREAAERAFDRFRDDPNHPALERTAIVRNAKSPDVAVDRVRVGKAHRAFVRRGTLSGDREVWVWEWIGTTEAAHTLYERGFAPSAAHAPGTRRIAATPTPTPARAPAPTETTEPKETEPMAAFKRGEPVAPPGGDKAATRVIEAIEVVSSRVSYERDLKDCVVRIMATIDSVVSDAQSRVNHARTELAEATRARATDAAELTRFRDLERSREALVTGERAARAEVEALRAERDAIKKRADQLTADNQRLVAADAPTRAEATKLRDENERLRSDLRARGKFCPHCGRDFTSGLRPGEVAP